MDSYEDIVAKLEKISTQIEQLDTKINTVQKGGLSFGLKVLRTSKPLDFLTDIEGKGTATKKYVLSFRAIAENWKGSKNDFLLIIRQLERENNQDIKALGIRIGLDIRILSQLVKESLSLLYVVCELKNIAINDILKVILNDINENGKKMIQELKEMMDLPI